LLARRPQISIDSQILRSSLDSGQFVEESFTNGAGTRGYKLFVPGGDGGQPRSLLVMLHGCTQTPDAFALGTGMNLLAQENSCCVLYPAQSASANSAKCWNWFNPADQLHGQGEPSIIAGITHCIAERYHIDGKRIYIAGLSAGGSMALILAATYPQLFAAAGVHSGMPYRSAQNLFAALTAMKHGAPALTPLAGKAIPIIVFQGDRDSTVNPKNGEQIISQWTAPSIAHELPGSSATESSKVNGRAYRRTIYRDAAGRIDAEYWLIKGAGHTWSGGNPRGSYADSKGPDASREMLRFFLHNVNVPVARRGARGVIERLVSTLTGRRRE
jgi:poly(hydroxyalkanoate) depolymerase family esterase